MPKKSRRTKAKHLAKSVKELQNRQRQQVKTTLVEPQLSTAMSPTSAKVSPKAPDSDDRYQYVIAEVKHIGIFAGVIILIIVVLSFILG